MFFQKSLVILVLVLQLSKSEICGVQRVNVDERGEWKEIEVIENFESRPSLYPTRWQLLNILRSLKGELQNVKRRLCKEIMVTDGPSVVIRSTTPEPTTTTIETVVPTAPVIPEEDEPEYGGQEDLDEEIDQNGVNEENEDNEETGEGDEYGEDYEDLVQEVTEPSPVKKPWGIFGI